MRVTVFGLGEAGSAFAAGLAQAGAEVIGFDPAPVTTPAGVKRAPDPVTAVTAADVVLALTASADADAALLQALDSIPPQCLYADLSTSAPLVKKRLAALAASKDLQFADVALMGVVPPQGLLTPAVVSGTGADRYVRTMAPFGVRAEAVSADAGDAATRKLLRSVMMKGLAALVIEAMRGAEAVDLSEWLWAEVCAEIANADQRLLHRLVTGTSVHAERRFQEMVAAQALLEELGVEPVITRSTVESLRRVPTEGVPALPPED